MARKPKFDPTGRAAKLFAALLALCVWQLAAVLIHNRLLLVGPVQVARRMVELLGEKTTWEALGFTFGRISLGFFLAFLAALVLAALSARFPWAETLLRPYILAIQTVPVASFIVIALLWLSSRRISAFIAFLMVLPVLYANALQGIREADPQLLEMARVFRLSGLRRVRCIILPSLAPYLEIRLPCGPGPVLEGGSGGRGHGCCQPFRGWDAVRCQGVSGDQRPVRLDGAAGGCQHSV